MKTDTPTKKPLWLRAIIKTARMTMSVYVGMLVFAFGCADQIIFQPPPAGYSESPELIKIQTPDHETICAYHLTNPAAEYTILLSHGNAEDIGMDDSINRMFKQRGYNIFAYDYRGYGLSTGRPSEKNTYEDIEAAYSYLTEVLNIPPEKIISLGRSVGSGPATYIASKRKVAALILESPFTSAYNVMAIGKFLPFDKYDNLSRIDKINCPLLIVHGTADRVIPFAHSQKLYAAAKEPKLNLWVESAGHNELYHIAAETYWQALKKLTNTIEQTN